jgi:hypothetical protein
MHRGSLQRFVIIIDEWQMDDGHGKVAWTK